MESTQLTMLGMSEEGTHRVMGVLVSLYVSVRASMKYACVRARAFFKHVFARSHTSCTSIIARAHTQRSRRVDSLCGRPH